jgi:hypothetical protein
MLKAKNFSKAMYIVHASDHMYIVCSSSAWTVNLGLAKK